MINAKRIYKRLLTDTRITALIDEENIQSSYPAEIEIYPCIIFLDDAQADSEYSDNKPDASCCEVEIHIYSKKLTGFVSTADVAVEIAAVMAEDLWHCPVNREVPDPVPDVEHRVMRFNKSIFN